MSIKLSISKGVRYLVKATLLLIFQGQLVVDAQFEGVFCAQETEHKRHSPMRGLG